MGEEQINGSGESRGDQIGAGIATAPELPFEGGMDEAREAAVIIWGEGRLQWLRGPGSERNVIVSAKIMGWCSNRVFPVLSTIGRLRVALLELYSVVESTTI